MEVPGEHRLVDAILEVTSMLLWVFAIPRGGSSGCPIAWWFLAFCGD